MEDYKNMELCFSNPGRYFQNKENIYSMDGSFNYSLWERYLSVFSKVNVVGRVSTTVVDKTKISKPYQSSTNRVSFIKIPYYVGPYGFLKSFFNIIRILNKESVKGRAYICRIPCILGFLFTFILFLKNIPYSVEVVGDPQDVFSKNGGVKNTLRPVFKYLFTYLMRFSVSHAACVLYVTEKTLQKKYPCSKKSFNINASNVNLDSSDYVKKPKCHLSKSKYRIISIGSLEQLYKAPDILIEALILLRDKSSIETELVWLGAGKYLRVIKSMAEKAGIKAYFPGNVSKREVFNYLKTSDLFCLVSRTEGLPRALIEAMSQGLPCIGTSVGGIPELLPSEAIVGINDISALTLTIENVLQSKKRYDELAKVCLEQSKSFLNTTLQIKRQKFYLETIKTVNFNV